MSPYHSDQMSQRSQVSRIALSKSKTPLYIGSQVLTGVGIELSQPQAGQLKTFMVLLNVAS